MIHNNITLSQAAAYLKISTQSVYQLIKSHKLEAEKLGGKWMLSQENIDKFIKDFNYTIEPDDHPRLSDELPDVVSISLCSGAGGLDLGMSIAGIKPVLLCEINKYCRMSIQNNSPEAALISDIYNYPAEKILEYARIPASRQVDVITITAPCQSFSSAGSRKGLDDMRGDVLLRCISIVKDIRPRYFVLENVRGLLSASCTYDNTDTIVKGGVLYTVLQSLESEGYSISFNLYNAANFGAPQSRERLIMIGKLGDSKVPYLSPTHSDNPDFNLPAWVTLGSAIDGLSAEQHYIPYSERKLKFYRMLKGGQYWKDLPPEYQQEAMGAKLKLGGGKTGFYRRLSLDKPSPTLVTDPTMPATSLCSPTEDRPLSIEEYKRIQGFPDDWAICGDIKEQYRQIGNAVPVQLGEAIGRCILADMSGIILPQYKGFRYSRYNNTDEESWKKQFEKIIKKNSSP